MGGTVGIQTGKVQMSDDQWVIENETVEEILRKAFLFDGFAETETMGQDFRNRACVSARAMKDGLYDRMVSEGLQEVRSGEYVAKLSTGLGGSLALRKETLEAGL